MAFIYAIVNYKKMRFLMYHKNLKLVNSNINRPATGGI
jgi:hypothetical protein